MEIDYIKRKVLDKINQSYKYITLLGIFSSEGNYKSYNTTLKLRDKEYGEIQEIKYDSFMSSGWSCDSRRKYNIGKANRKFKDIKELEGVIEDHLNKTNKANRSSLVYCGLVSNTYDYISNTSKIKLRCDIHNYERIIDIGHFLRGNEYCKECRKALLEQSPEDAFKTAVKSFEDPSKILYDLSPIKDTYKSKDEDVEIICPYHGSFNIRYRSIITRRNMYPVSCPICRKQKTSDILTSNQLSEGEKRCQETLNNLGIKYISHKLIWITYTPYINRSYLLPDLSFTFNNKEYIIEYNGVQHYRFNKFFYKEYKNFNYQVNRDNYIKEYCNLNNINLLVIPYIDDKNIERLINDFLFKGQDNTTKVFPILLPLVL